MRTISFAIVVVGASALVIVGFFLPWFSFPDIALTIGHISLPQRLPDRVSGLDMLLGGQTYAHAYAPFLLPEIFALLWLLPVSSLLLSVLMFVEMVGGLRKRLWGHGFGWVRWLLMALLLALMCLVLGPVVVGPDGPPQLNGDTNRLSGIAITFVGFLLLMLSVAWLAWQQGREAFLAARAISHVEKQIQPLSRRRVLFALFGLIAATAFGSGGYLAERLWVRRRVLASFPLLSNFQQPSKPNLQALFPVIRDGRIFWSADSKRLLTFLVDFYVHNREASNGETLRIYPFPTQDAALSPDSSLLALLDPMQGTPAIVAVDRGTVVVPAHSQNVLARAARSLAWSPDGKRLAIGGALLNPQTQTIKSAGIWCYDALSEENLRTYQTGNVGNLQNVSWSPDGRYLVGVGDVTLSRSDELPGSAFVWEVESGQLIFNTPANYWSAVAWSPDSRRLALAYGNKVEIWEPSSSRRLLVYQAHLTEVWALAWSPGGKYLASASSADGLIHIWESTGGQLRQLYQGHSRTVTDLAWSPDGASLASCDRGKVNIWPFA